MNNAGKVILSIIVVVMGIFFIANAYDGYQQSQKDVEVATKNVEIAKQELQTEQDSIETGVAGTGGVVDSK